jgi:hypothetical protein
MPLRRKPLHHRGTETRRSSERSSGLGFPRIKDLDAEGGKVPHVPRDQRKAVMKGCGCKNAVNDRWRPALLFRDRRQTSPPFGNRFGNRQDATGKPGTNIDIQPVLQFGTPGTSGQRGHAFADFTDCHDAQEHAVSMSVSEKPHDEGVRIFASQFRRDVRIDQVSPHRSRSRPVSRSRSKSRFRPRSGSNS